MLSHRRRVHPIRELTPAKEGPLHVGWQRLRAALRGAGIADGLVRRSLSAWLGPHAQMRPTPRTVFALLDEYFHNEGAGSPREGRYVSHRAGERDSARQVVARLATQLPELGTITLVEENHRGKNALVLRTLGDHVVVPDDEIVEEHFVSSDVDYVQRTVAVETLIASVNELVAHRGLTFRFLPLHTSQVAEAYLAVEPAGAQLLDEVDLWAFTLPELYEFAGWEGLRASRVPEEPPRKEVA